MTLSQVRQDPVVEEVLEHRVLVGRPLIEQVARTVLQPGAEQGQAFALSGGQRQGRQLSILDTHFMLQLQVNQVFPSLLHPLWVIAVQQIFEQAKVGKNRREVLPVMMTAAG
ncbi:hypothetical protein D9M72_603520 [compost metagenome]